MSPETRSFLPSKKFIIRIGIIVSLIVIFFVGRLIVRKIQNNQSGAKITLGDITHADQDGNGIPDWQDSLYALQPDRLTPEERAKALQNPSFTTGEATTKTEQLAKEMYVVINSLSQGGTLDPTVKENLTNMLSSYISGINKPRVWTVQDLKTAGNNDAAIQQYVAEYSVLVALYKPAPSPIPMLESAIYLDDPDGLERSLATQINLHADALVGLQSMTVPQKAVKYHLAIMNGVQAIHDDTVNISKYFTDPLLTFSAILGYNEHAQDFVNAVNAINEDFFLPLAGGSIPYETN